MEEDMMMPNVAPAPMMQETPMAPNLSEQMPAQTEEVTQAEMQEAQGALQQILQVIDMLIQQGLSAEEIAQFLEQYGISEDELEQAAQILGVDINQLLGGQMQQPQEPMMMAAGGPAKNVSDRTQSEQNAYSSFRDAVLNPNSAGSPIQKKLYLEAFGPEIYAMDETNILAGDEPNEFIQRGIEMFGKYRNTPITVAPSVISSLPDNEPTFQSRSPENQIFSLQTSIDNLMSEYDMLVRNKEFDRAQAVANEINNIDVQISQIKAGSPMMMAGGGPSTSIDPSYISEYLQMLQNDQAEKFRLSRKAPGINPTGLSPDISLAQRRQQFETAKRDLRQATRALNPEVFEIYEAGQFGKLPTGLSKLAIEDYINFVDQKKQNEKKN